jgi:hypothetical protein
MAFVMFGSDEAVPWSLDNDVWGRAPEGAEPPLAACWLPPPLIAVEGIPASADEPDPGTVLEETIDIPSWCGVSEPWIDPIIGTDPNPVDPAPEPELSGEPASWDDLIYGEYRLFVEENPQWLEENGGGGMQLQVMTPSTYLPWIELGTPGQAMAFDRWYHQTYLAPVPVLPELPEEPAPEPVPWLSHLVLEPVAWDLEGGEFDGDVMVELCISSYELRNLQVVPIDLEPREPAPSPIASLQTEPFPPAQDGLEPAAITADRPPSLQAPNPFPNDFAFPSPIHSRSDSRGDGVAAFADQAASPGADQDLEDSIPSPSPLPAQEGVSNRDAESLLVPLGLNLPDLRIWRPVRLEPRSKA